MSEYTKEELMADPRTMGQMADAVEVSDPTALDLEMLRTLAARDSGRTIDPATLPDRKVEGEPAELSLEEVPEKDEGMIYGGKKNVFRW